jgi:hypothetical protein
MQDQPSSPDPRAQIDNLEYVVLHLMLDSDSKLWSEAEICTALGSPVNAADAVVGLHVSGLVHRFNEFVFPTQAAARCVQLESVV